MSNYDGQTIEPKWRMVRRFDASDFPTDVNEELIRNDKSTHYTDDSACIDKESYPITFSWLVAQGLKPDSWGEIPMAWNST